MFAPRTAYAALAMLTGTMMVAFANTEMPADLSEPEPVCVPAAIDYGTFCPQIAGFDWAVREAANLYEVDPDLLVAQVMKESSCNPVVIGDGGRAYGLGQIHPRWWRKRLTAEGLISEDHDLLTLVPAVRSMAYINAYHLSRTKGDLHDAVRRYNGTGKKAHAYADDVLVRMEAVRVAREDVEVSCDG